MTDNEHTMLRLGLKWAFRKGASKEQLDAILLLFNMATHQRNPAFCIEAFVDALISERAGYLTK